MSYPPRKDGHKFKDSKKAVFVARATVASLVDKAGLVVDGDVID